MEEILFQEGIFECVQEEKSYCVNGLSKQIKRTFVRRPPGIRAIIINQKGEILLTRW